MSTFIKDPNLDGIDPASLKYDVYQLDNNTIQNFGLPFIAGWRTFHPQHKDNNYWYNRLVEEIKCLVTSTGHIITQVEQCRLYGPRGGESVDDTISIVPPIVHMYPMDDLHVTIATFRNTLKNTPPEDDAHAAAIKSFCVKIIENASKQKNWPTDCELIFQPKEVKLGQKNAYILWEDKSGNIDIIRQCLHEEMDKTLQCKDDLKIDIEKDLAWFVPNIVHTTILRLWKDGDSNSAENRLLYKKFQNLFQGGTLLKLIPKEVIINCNPALVCETMPCMHVEVDKEHVLWGNILKGRFTSRYTEK